MSVREISTSPGLSSPPSPADSENHISPPTSLPHSKAAAFAQKEHSFFDLSGEKANKSIASKNTSASATKKPRKKKDPGPTSQHNNDNASSATVTDGQQTKAATKPRAKRGTSEAFKKRQRLAEEAKAREEADAQAKINASPNTSLTPTSYIPAGVTPHQNGNIEAIHNSLNNTQNMTPKSRATSGQNYDPIRSSTVAPRPHSPIISSLTPQKSFNHSSASASPSIYSIIDRPNHTYTPPQLPNSETNSKAYALPEVKRFRLSPPPSVPYQHQQTVQPRPRESLSALPDLPATNKPYVMDMDADKSHALPVSNADIGKKPSPKTSTAVSSSSHSPKPTRTKEASIPMSSGSGLLSGSIFGSGYDSAVPEKSAPTVILDVPLTGDHQYVNFTRLAEERYGFNALHPRLAAQRERLARVAAAGAALDSANKNIGNSGSADDMSLDLSDGDADNSNVELGGVNDGDKYIGARSGEETGEAGEVKKRRKRTMKEDMYDKEDDFIDDTELIWEEQAATSKDGFFVYSGPLIPPGEEPAVERWVKLLKARIHYR